MKKSLIGKVFGRLTVVEDIGMIKDRHFFKCLCSCGNYKDIRGDNLKNNAIKSCGCLQGINNTSYGMSKTPTYRTWLDMRQRCSNKNNKAFKDYGGRGIKVCDRWKNSFENFYIDIGERPKNKTLDRIDNNGDYCKKNCKWANNLEQQNNRRDNYWITINGERKTVAQWTRLRGFKRHLIYNRLRKGWSEKNAILMPDENSCKKNTEGV